MTLAEAITAAGMTPPRAFTEGRWLRFPGIGKGRSNRSGWCRVISPTLAVFGDWSSGLTQVWRDEAHHDDERSRAALQQAQERERRYAAQERAKQATVAAQAAEMLGDAEVATHPYLARKGFPALTGLTLNGNLLVPVMDLERYPKVITVQVIYESGEKKFLHGGRAKGGVFRLGVSQHTARRVILCEGYGTGLSLEAAARRLPGDYSVLACFSAKNMETVAGLIPISDRVLVAADNDKPNKLSGEKAGEESAKRTGHRWVMPPDVGDDWNDVHLKRGVMAVVEAIRST